MLTTNHTIFSFLSPFVQYSKKNELQKTQKKTQEKQRKTIDSTNLKNTVKIKNTTALVCK